MIFDPSSVLVAVVAASFSLSALAASISWLQRMILPSRVTLAVFFAVFAVSEFDTLTRLITASMPQFLRDGLEYLGLTANFLLGPLLFFYVRDLTGSMKVLDLRRTIFGHFALPCLAGIFVVVAMMMPPATREYWYTGASPAVSTPGLQFLRYGFTILIAALSVQWVIYVIWVVRIQAQHVRRLKQHFATTEGLELRWIAIVACVLGVYVLQNFFGQFLRMTGVPDPIGFLADSTLVLFIVTVLALWGLRPAPELEEVRKTLDTLNHSLESKYEKSALGSDQANRIAQKLLRAMERDKLYRDPNLTLSKLAEHIGVSLNYASQTMNQTIGQSFFEFVNEWRIKEAIPLVRTGEITVLSIAYEVGFNSRSSFYTSFKRVTGMTPTAYKKASTKAVHQERFP